MSTSDSWLNLLTGISQGRFHSIYIDDGNGNYVDILTLMGSGGGGGGIVNSVTLPLSISNGVLSINTSTFCTAASAPLALHNTVEY